MISLIHPKEVLIASVELWARPKVSKTSKANYRFVLGLSYFSFQAIIPIAAMHELLVNQFVYCYKVKSKQTSMYPQVLYTKIVCRPTETKLLTTTNKLQRAKGGCLGTGKPMKDAVSCEKLREDANNL